VTRTKPAHLVLLLVVGAVLTWLLETALAASGRAVLIPPFTLAVALLLIGVIVVLMALPVRRVARRIPGSSVDPFYATRVVVIAKASSLTGALLAGAGFGVGFYLLSRAVLPAVGSITMAFATAVGAVVLLVGGLVAEYMCTIPPDDESDGDPNPPSQEVLP
jgi:uncharacterized membrane protein YbhN (UPF0104 family)